MGQAKLRGTTEQRTAEAIAARDAARAERKRIADEREQARDRVNAAKWAAMTQEQRDAAVERAKREAANYGELAEIFGHDVAFALNSIMHK